MTILATGDVPVKGIGQPVPDLLSALRLMRLGFTFH